MDRIEFDAHFGDEIKHVEISQAYMGSEGWNVLVNLHCVAVIIPRRGEYCYHDANLDTSDIQAIVDRITDFTGEGYKQAQFYKFG